MHMAKKEGQRQRKQKEQCHDQQQHVSPCARDENPTMYSSKMMDSIWGMYNKYAVHNLNRNTGGQQETMGGCYDTSVVDVHQMNAGGGCPMGAQEGYLMGAQGGYPMGAQGGYPMGAQGQQNSGGFTGNNPGYLYSLVDQVQARWMSIQK